MKTNIKYFLLTLSSIAFALGFSSCSSDGYSLGDMYASLVTVHTDDGGYAKSFTLDNGQTMFVASTATSYKPKNERAVINYTILGDKYGGYDYAIKLNGYFEDVLTKPIIYVPADDQVKQDSIGHNNIKVFSAVAKGNYISIRFGVNMSNKDQHLLNLVAVDENKVQQGAEPIKLQFRHNINKDEEHYASPKTYVSFKLDEYIEANSDKKEIQFEVSWTDYDGKAKKEVLKYTLPLVSEPPVEGVE